MWHVWNLNGLCSKQLSALATSVLPGAGPCSANRSPTTGWGGGGILDQEGAPSLGLKEVGWGGSCRKSRELGTRAADAGRRLRARLRGCCPGKGRGARGEPGGGYRRR